MAFFLGQFIFFDVLYDFPCSNKFSYFEYLINAISSKKERSSVKNLYEHTIYHSCKNKAYCPDINPVVIIWVAKKQFRTLVIKGGHMSIVLSFWKIKFCQSEINYFERFIIRIDEHIKRFNVPMHNTLRMNVV